MYPCRTGLLDGSNGRLCRCAEPDNVLLSTSLGQVGRDELAALMPVGVRHDQRAFGSS